MFLAVGLQIATTAILALLVSLPGGWDNARYVLLGGAAAIVPNGLFALRLALNRGRSPESYPVVFFLGYLVKLILTIGFLGLIVRYAEDVRWPALLLGFAAALQVTLFALAFQRVDRFDRWVGTREEGARSGAWPAEHGASNN